MPVKKDTEWATIGKIVALFGLRGDLKVRSLTDIPGRFAQLEAVYLSPEYKPYTIEEVRPYKGDMLLIRLGGIADANAAEPLRDKELCIPVAKLAQLPPDSYYQHDILGLRVVKLDGTPVGVVVDIIATGSNDVYAIKAEDGKQFLIPAVKAVIKQVDLIRHVMYIDPMRGLLDDDAEFDEQTSVTEEEET